MTDALTCCREDVLIATKVAGPSGQMQWIRGGPRCLDAQNITEAIDGSLHRLQTDYIDLIQLHWPDRSGSCLTTTAAVTGPGHATASGAGLGAAEGASHPEGLPAATGAGGSCLGATQQLLRALARGVQASPLTAGPVALAPLDAARCLPGSAVGVPLSLPCTWPSLGQLLEHP